MARQAKVPIDGTVRLLGAVESPLALETVELEKVENRLAFSELCR